MKLSIFADDMIVYVENSKKSEKDRDREKEKEKSFLELTIQQSRGLQDQHTKINPTSVYQQWPVGNPNLKCNAIYKHSLKYLDVKLTKYNQDQYAEHDKTLMKNSKKI